MDRIVIISDTQIPYHDERAVRNVIEFIGTWQPDHLVHVGDLMDFPTPARWSKDTRVEYAGSVKRDAEEGKRFLGDVRRVYAGPWNVLEGNHDLRPRVYLEQYAPALGDYPFDIGTLLDFDGHGVNLVEGFFDFAAGWTVTHGHLGFTLSQLAGRTALLAAKKIGKSVIMGHTHRLAVTGESYGYNGEVSTYWGMEVGHLCSLRKMGYLKNGGANWQQGFGIVFVNGDQVTPIPVPVHKSGTFTVDGYTFGAKAAA